MSKRLLGLGIGAVIGGVVGYMQWLCPDGSCALTGSWLGGAFIGGWLGMLLLGGCPACAGGACELPRSSGASSAGEDQATGK